MRYFVCIFYKMYRNRRPRLFAVFLPFKHIGVLHIIQCSNRKIHWCDVYKKADFLVSLVKYQKPCHYKKLKYPRSLINKCDALENQLLLLVSSWSMQLLAPSQQGPVSISEKMSYRKISWSLEAARFVLRIVWSLWNLTGTSAALLPMCLSNFKTIRQFKVPISWLLVFTRSYDKTSFRILRRGPGCYQWEVSRWGLIHLRISKGGIIICRSEEGPFNAK